MLFVLQVVAMPRTVRALVPEALMAKMPVGDLSIENALHSVAWREWFRKRRRRPLTFMRRLGRLALSDGRQAVEKFPRDHDEHDQHDRDLYVLLLSEPPDAGMSIGVAYTRSFPTTRPRIARRVFCFYGQASHPVSKMRRWRSG